MKQKKINTIKNNTIDALKSLGIYRKEHDTIIEFYAGLIERYLKLKEEITQDDYLTRTPATISLETLRKDILQYSSQLGLTPSGYRKIAGDSLKAQPHSKLEDALNAFDSEK